MKKKFVIALCALISVTFAVRWFQHRADERKQRS